MTYKKITKINNESETDILQWEEYDKIAYLSEFQNVTKLDHMSWYRFWAIIMNRLLGFMAQIWPNLDMYSFRERLCHCQRNPTNPNNRRTHVGHRRSHNTRDSTTPPRVANGSPLRVSISAVREWGCSTHPPAVSTMLLPFVSIFLPLSFARRLLADANKIFPSSLLWWGGQLTNYKKPPPFRSFFPALSLGREIDQRRVRRGKVLCFRLPLPCFCEDIDGTCRLPLGFETACSWIVE